MLDIVRDVVRVKNNSFDLELIDLIEAAKLDLKISGVVKIDTNDALIKRAIKIYCQANFGLDNKDSEKYQNSYNMLKEHLALCGEYNVE